MMSLLSGLWPYLIAGAASLLVAWRAWASIKKSGIDEQKAKEAEQRERDLERIKAAGAAVPGSVSDDPFNRDNQKP